MAVYVPDVTMPLSRFGSYQRRFTKSLYERVVKRGIRDAGPQLVARLQAETLAKQVFWRGRVLKGWKTLPIELASIRITNKAVHYANVEFGRRAGALPPPVNRLLPWVRTRWGLQGREARSAAIRLAKAISRRGIQAKRIVTDGTFRFHAMIIIDRQLQKNFAAAARTKP